MLKLIPKLSINPIEIRKSIEIYYLNTPKSKMLASMLEPFARGVKAPARFLRNLFFGTSGGGPPLDRVWPPLGHPWSDLFDLLKDFGSNFAPKIKHFKATNCTNYNLKEKQGFQHTLLRINPNETFVTCVVLQSHVSPNPKVLNKKGPCRNDPKRTPKHMPLRGSFKTPDHFNKTILIVFQSEQIVFHLLNDTPGVSCYWFFVFTFNFVGHTLLN